MKRVICGVLALALIGISGRLWAQGKFDLENQESKSEKMSLSDEKVYIEFKEEKPSDLKAMPKGISDKLAYCQHQIEGKPLIFILDSGGEKAKLYIDTDMDGDLSDEKPKTGKPGLENEGETNFDKVTIKVKVDGKETEINIIPKVRIYENRGYLFLKPGSVRVGKAKLGDKTYMVGLADSDIDGRYDSFMKGDWGDSDMMGIDLDRDGSIVRSYDNKSEVSPLMKMVKVDDSYYEVDIATDGSSIEFKKAKKFGTLDIKSPELVSLGLLSTNGFFRLNKGEGGWQVPVGTYQTIYLALIKKDKDGIEWTLDGSRYGSEKLKALEIVEGKTTTISAGLPLVMKPDVQVNNETVAINCNVIGKAGERYGGGASKNGKTQPAPTFKIVDKDGKEIVSDSLKYG